MRPYARLTARIGLDTALGITAFILVVLFFFLSHYASFLPVAEANRATTIAVLEKNPGISFAHVQKVTEASHWYLEAVLPALIGIGQGLIVGLFRRGARPVDAVVTGLAFSAILLATSGRTAFYDFATIVGPILLTFCTMGSTALGQSLRAARVEGAGIAGTKGR